MKTVPKCIKTRCPNPCQYYGQVGGYSAHCKEHNRAHAAWLRANRAKLKAQRGYAQLRDKKA